MAIFLSQYLSNLGIAYFKEYPLGNASFSFNKDCILLVDAKYNENSIIQQIVETSLLSYAVHVP